MTQRTFSLGNAFPSDGSASRRSPSPRLADHHRRRSRASLGKLDRARPNRVSCLAGFPGGEDRVHVRESGTTTSATQKTRADSS